MNISMLWLSNIYPTKYLSSFISIMVWNFHTMSHQHKRKNVKTKLKLPLHPAHLHTKHGPPVTVFHLSSNPQGYLPVAPTPSSAAPVWSLPTHTPLISISTSFNLVPPEVWILEPNYTKCMPVESLCNTCDVWGQWEVATPQSPPAEDIWQAMEGEEAEQDLRVGRLPDAYQTNMWWEQPTVLFKWPGSIQNKT